MKPPSVPMIVVICCGCCFLQSTIAFVVLLPNIYIRKCYISINFAIMQFCLSISATMSFIILGLLKFLPQVSDVKLIWLIYMIAFNMVNWGVRLGMVWKVCHCYEWEIAVDICDKKFSGMKIILRFLRKKMNNYSNQIMLGLKRRFFSL